MSFPTSYPLLPPLVTFSTDMFHPLITPLTTYMYTTDIQDNGTVSATDDERLPAGGFSLRHGFPDWFGRGRRSATGSRQTSGQHAPADQPVGQESATASSAINSPETVGKPVPSYMRTNVKQYSIYDILKYIKGAFDDEEVLDSVPLAAAGNPGAWHAWRTHRRKLGKLPSDPAGDEAVGGSAKAPEETPAEAPAPTSPRKVQSGMRPPSEWNWDGVWEDRVKKGVNASLSEPGLYGPSSPADDMVRTSVLARLYW
jgi:hypothetical protein